MASTAKDLMGTRPQISYSLLFFPNISISIDKFQIFSSFEMEYYVAYCALTNQLITS